MAISEEARLRILLEAKNNAGPAFAALNAQMNGLTALAMRAAGILAGAFAFHKIIEDTRQWGDEVHKLSMALGINAQEASKLNYVAQGLGMSTDQLIRNFTVFSRHLVTGMADIKKGTSIFDNYGIKLLDANGHVKGFSDALMEVHDHLGMMGNSLLKTGEISTIFGRNATDINRILSMSKQELKAWMDEAVDLGMVLDETGEKRLVDFNYQMNKAGLAFKSLAIHLGTLLLPFLTQLLRLFIQFVRDVVPHIAIVLGPIIDGFRELFGAVWNLVVAFGRVILALLNAGSAGQRLSGILKVIGEAFRTVLGIVKEVTARLEKFAKDISEDGVIGAIWKLMTDLLSTFGQKLSDIGGWFDDLTGRGTPLNVIIKAIAVSLGLLIAEHILIGLSNLARAILLVGTNSVLSKGYLLELVVAAILIKDTFDRLQTATDKVNFSMLLGTGVVAGLVAGLLGFGPVGILVGAALGLLLIAFDQIGQTIALVKGNWDKFVYAFQHGLLDDIPVFGGVFHALRDIGDLIKEVQRLWDQWWTQAKSGFFDDIPIVGGVFKAVQWILDRIKDIWNMWNQLPSWLGGNGGGSSGGGGGGGGSGGSGSGGGSPDTWDAKIQNCLASNGHWVYDNANAGNAGHCEANVGGNPAAAPQPPNNYGGVVGGPGGWTPPPTAPPAGGQPYAEGGIVMPRPGGTQVTVGEGGVPEAIVPMGRSGRGFGNTITIIVNATGNLVGSEAELGRIVARAILRDAQLKKQLAF